MPTNRGVLGSTRKLRTGAFVLLVGLVAPGCTGGEDSGPVGSSAPTRSTTSATTGPSPSTARQAQEQLELLDDAQQFTTCPFSTDSPPIATAIGQVFGIEGRPVTSFASGRLSTALTCRAEWGRDRPYLEIAVRQTSHSQVTDVEAVSPLRAASAGEDNPYVACEFTIGLGSFDVLVSLENGLFDCSAVEPQVGAITAAVLEAIGQMSG